MLRPACPCPSGLPYDACCGRFHRGDGDLRERSRFERRGGRWCYVDGVVG